MISSSALTASPTIRIGGVFALRPSFDSCLAVSNTVRPASAATGRALLSVPCLQDATVEHVYDFIQDMDILTPTPPPTCRALLRAGSLTAGILIALVLLPSFARAEAAHGTIEVAGTEATFHVTVPPKEDWSSFFWYANAYTDRTSDHCATPESNDIVAVSGEEAGTEATFSANLAELRDHIGTWDICLYAHGSGAAGEGLVAEASYIYPSPTGTITVTSHAPNALELPGWMER